MEKEVAQASQEKVIIQLLLAMYRLLVQAVRKKKPQEVHFLMLNETIQVSQYDRATLWSEEDGKPKFLGVSGQTDVDKTSDLYKSWIDIAENITEKEEIHRIELSDLSPGKGEESWKNIEKSHPLKAMLWIPIFVEEKLYGGLLLERWHDRPWVDKELELLEQLSKGYGATLEKYTTSALKKVVKSPRLKVVLGVLILLLLFVRVPLRIVAPCEVVPQNPILVTAPLNGIISETKVDPGQFVEKERILFEYDKNIPQQELKMAMQQVEIAESELKRAIVLGLSDEEARSRTGILSLELEKAEINLGLAKYRASQLTVRSPEAGYVQIDDPDDWRGKPVVIGERVMVISRQDQTKIRIWIPENDNIPLNTEEPIKIFLNIRPESSYLAQLLFINDYSTVDERQVVSFAAEADWKNGPEGVKLGLKGTAILYGDSVSLAYYVLRKPWATARNLFGI
ncbi:MAG: hypothetical protein K940chlam7_01451 [Chlamydiae bacterium]|nr:hypothetical protein [Chlamydiota bacterium]